MPAAPIKGKYEKAGPLFRNFLSTSTMKYTTFAAIAAGLSLSAAHGQGLLSIGADNDYSEQLPFSVTLASSIGWDSNTNSRHSNENESGYLQNGISVYLPMGDRRNHLNLGAHYSNIWYFDVPEGEKDTFHNARFTLDFVKAISPRLTIADSFYIAYENEPDYVIGGNVPRGNRQYLYGYNNLSVSYAWTPRFSTVTSYTLTGIWYEDDDYYADGSRDYLFHIFGNQFRYALSKTTTLTLEYRYGFTQYDKNEAAESETHYILAGIDQVFSPRLTGSLRVGAELRDYDGPQRDRDRPYLEGAITYRAGKNTILRWYHHLGANDGDLAGFYEGYGYRTGLTLTHRVSEPLTLKLALHYIHQEYSDSPYGWADEEDDTFAGSIGIDYRVWRNIGVNANYQYTTTSSDNIGRDYERHRVSFGVTATF